MGKIKIKLNGAGIRKMLKSKEIEKICSDYGTAIRNRAGEGYETGIRKYPERTGCVVIAVTHKAKKDNMENNTLIKAVNF